MAKKPEDHKQDDQILENYLQGGSALSEAYRAEEKVRPPAHLDKAILLAASEAVKSKQLPKVAYSPFARSWYVPASMAAVLTLCVGLVFTIYKDSGQTLLTAPKSEYDIDTQTVPVEAVKSIGQGGINTAGEKNRRYKYAEEIVEEAEMSMDVTLDENKPVPSSIEDYGVEEPELEKRPASKKLSREKMIEMNNDFHSETSDKNAPKQDTSKQTLSDAPYLLERRDFSERLEAADVKKQKQMDADVLNNILGDMELRANEEEAELGANSAQGSRNRKVEESLLKENRILNKDSLDDITVDRLVSPAQSLGGEMMSPEQWLNQINDLWLSGDHLIAKENLKQFFEVYPDYPIDKIKTILDPQIELMEYAR